MSQRKRRILTIIAIALFVLAAAALVYSLLPTETLHDTLPVTPTYLLPPAGVP